MTSETDRWTFSGDQLEEAWTDLSFNRLPAAEKTADELLAGQGVKLDKESSAYRKLCRELLVAKMQLLKTEIQRMDGEYVPVSAVRHNGSSAGATPSAAVPTKPFSEVSVAYLKEFSNRQPRTQEMIRLGFVKFLKVTGGDRPIGSITKDECRAYKESMTKDGLVAAKVNKHLHCLSHCLTWAHGQGFLPEDWKNPVAGLRIAKSIVRSQKVKVVPFTDEDFSVIFTSKEFTRWKVTNPERYYGLLALLLTAARREEVYQLDVANVKQAAATGIWSFTFTGGDDDDKDKTVKNVASNRTCPLPELLIELGFLDYVRSIKAKRLFPQLTHGGNGYGDGPGRHGADWSSG